jgi:hypothetical protein
MFLPKNPERIVRLEEENFLAAFVAPEGELNAAIGVESDSASVGPVRPDEITHLATLQNREPTTTGESRSAAAGSRKAG